MSADNSNSPTTRIGVLALQGSFREHMSLLKMIPGVEVIEIRTKEELQSVQGLVIPGGESTTMALVAERWGLIPELQAFHKEGKPIWGTCAGMIFLAERADGMKQGGQALLGGLDIAVSRNFFGAQLNSFETPLPAPDCIKAYGGPDNFRAVFIRAPAVLEAGAGVEALARYTLSEDEKKAQGKEEVIVAVKSGVLLATAFHPELTTDKRWHQLFVDMVRKHAGSLPAVAAPSVHPFSLGREPNRPLDLPVYAQRHMEVER